MEQEYSTEQFARLASVSVRTLRWYDREGLLTPARRTAAGHRRYTDGDLVVLQQILALKFLGFSLEQIRVFIYHRPFNLRGVLGRQRAMLLEQRAHLDTVIEAIAAAEQAATDGSTDWKTMTRIIEVIQMDQHDQWVDKYFTPEQRDAHQKLIDQSFNDSAKAKFAARGPWTEADQQRADAQYAALAADLKRVAASGAAVDSPEAQDLAARQSALLEQFTQGDPDIEAGLNTLWQTNEALPQSEQSFRLPWSDEEHAFLQSALKVYNERNRS